MLASLSEFPELAGERRHDALLWSLTCMATCWRKLVKYPTFPGQIRWICPIGVPEYSQLAISGTVKKDARPSRIGP